MKDYIIKLDPRSSFEVNAHSDTLFGAICWGIRTLLGETFLLNILKQFNFAPPFLISSAFPCRLDKEEYYLPKPFFKPLTHNELESFADKYVGTKLYHSDNIRKMQVISKYKEFKKLQWIPYENFQTIIKKSEEKKIFKDFLGGQFDKLPYTNHIAVQKNVLDRLSNSTTGSGDTFYNQEFCFRPKWGVYFLLKTDKFDEVILPVLKFLEDSGIGSNARTGKNWFYIKWQEKSLCKNESNKAFITLSRYIKNEPLNIENCFYKLNSIRSKVESRDEFAGKDIWKNRVNYFTEGSVLFPQEKKEFYGGIFPVKEIAGKTIYQYGYAYPIWINLEVKDE